MVSKKILAIWMDHSIAYLMYLGNDTIVTGIIKSKPVHPAVNPDAHKGGRHCSGTDHQTLSLFVRQIHDAIIDYDYVRLYGPSGSVNGLFDYLLHNHLFDKINISLKYADEMDIMDMEKWVRSRTLHTVHRYSAFQKRANAFFQEIPSGHLASMV